MRGWRLVAYIADWNEPLQPVGIRLQSPEYTRSLGASCFQSMPPSWCNAQPHLDPVHGNEGPEAFDVVVAEEQAAGECFVTWKPGMRKGVANSKRICSSYVGGLETSRDAHARKGKTRDMVAPACTDSKSAFSYGLRCTLRSASSLPRQAQSTRASWRHQLTSLLKKNSTRLEMQSETGISSSINRD
ncbi:hypothetical protein EV129_11777 [Rhizobium azibense]|uniref:Uncharacterized protein n=1 Tax=Rhizobium azibense TaxID=1136135 RepID=A0A4R3RCB3_9HYPH|nr:hypothetical protein EV129_11777 [Rhizobium azibense]